MIKMCPADVRPRHEKYLRAINELNCSNKKRGKVRFKIGDAVRISGFKSVFVKGYTPSWSTEIFKVVNVADTKPVTEACYLLASRLSRATHFWWFLQ